MGADTFFAENPQFYVIHTGQSTDVLTPWLLQRNLIDRPVANAADAWLFEAEAAKPE